MGPRGGNRRGHDGLEVDNIDLWTDCIAGGLSADAWRRVLRDAGFVAIEVGPAVDTFGGAAGEATARRFQVFGHAFFARKPSAH